jgi:hypothetical protein
MKNLAKIAMGLMLLMMPMTLIAQTASEARKTLKAYCDEKNEDCPIKDGDDDAYYVLFGFEDDQMNIVYGVGTEPFAMLKQNKKALLKAVNDELKTNEELLGMVIYLTACNGTLAFIICDYNGDIEDENNRLLVGFEAKDLKELVRQVKEGE